MTRSKWKGPYCDIEKLKNNKQTNILYKNSEIVPKFIGKTFQVYNGKNYTEVSITDGMINHKFGEFVFTRGKFSFKKKK